LLIVLFGAAIAFTLAVAWRAWRRDDLIVYCAHDAIFADGILRAFEKESGLRVGVRYDTEATKSLGLVELLVREASAPRADVFWNNEALGTIDLARRGLLEPYQGVGFARIPAKFKDAQGNWAGFAGRLRVIIRGARHPSTAGRALPPTLPAEISRWAIAKPLYGTTLTHYAAWWRELGRDPLIAWHREWRARGGRELNGNAAVKDAVALGVCDFGFTDSDDFFAAHDEGKAVAMEPARLASGQTVCIPNSVAIIRDARHHAAARQLVDFLLSAKTELALARSKSRQIPLGPVPADELPMEVRELRAWAAESAPMAELVEARTECLAWLKSEYLR
jgi:iron(III) transport system substrate-binding protein